MKHRNSAVLFHTRAQQKEIFIYLDTRYSALLLHSMSMSVYGLSLCVEQSQK